MPDSVTEYSRHLRTVHFSLVMVSVIILIASFSENRTVADKTYDEYLEIEAAMSNWGQFSIPWIFREEIRTGVRFVKSPSVTMHTSDPEHQFLNGVSFRPDVSVFYHSLNGHYLWEEYPIFHDPKTIDDFRKIWAKVRQTAILLYPSRLGEQIAVSSDFQTWKYVDVSYSEFISERDPERAPGFPYPLLSSFKPVFVDNYEENPQVKLKVDGVIFVQPKSVVDSWKKRGWKWVGRLMVDIDSNTPKQKLFFDDLSDNSLIIIPTEVQSENVDLFQLMNESTGSEWMDLDFEDAFPNLNRIVDQYPKAPIGVLGDFLKYEKEKESSFVEAVGVKVPMDAISSWGIAILSLIQMYFWLHYRSFLNLEDDTTNNQFPWIGVYSDKISGLVFFVSITLLPAVAILAAWFRAMEVADDWIPILWSALPLVAGLTFALLTAMTVLGSKETDRLEDSETKNHDVTVS